ncbi:MAG: aminopeptidase [Cytophagales bacterium]|nr:aminopeptidase [Armatimonadota bacterium]
MPDPRVAKLADVLVAHSTKLQPGEKVLIETFDAPDEIVTALIERVVEAEAIPFVETRSNRVLRTLYKTGTEAQMRQIGSHELERMKTMDAYIAVRGAMNALEMADVPGEKMHQYQANWWRPVADYRVNSTKWVVLRYPSSSFAQAAGMSTDQFTDFYFNVCTLDYDKMGRAQVPLHARMEKADRVRLTGRNTDLSFSIKGIGAVMCTGDRNIPDGECFSCPVKESVNGTIHFNAPTTYQGRPFDSIRLVFRNGKVIEATGSDTAALNAILDSDEGARYIGEFSIAFNPYILTPMRDILFDEKINGSFHFTPGNAYETAGNGNKSQVHWDMVFIQRPEYGGGDIYFDDELIRRDGVFVPSDLHGLNPENLK